MKHYSPLPLVMVFAAAIFGNGCSSPKTQANVALPIAPTVAPAPAATAGEVIALENTSFVGDAEKRLPGWIKSEHGGGQSYTFQSDDKVFHSAPSSARIERHGKELFGMLSQWIPVDPKWHGRTIRVSAFVKAEGLDTEGRGGGALIIRADRVGGGYSGHNFMDTDRLKGTVDWQPLQVEMELNSLAGTLRVGAMLQGGGTMWVDDLRVEVLAQN